ncbi:MAG: exodeoxyribonuclease V subunit gamma [Simkania negevensis]|nr:exodeoxyribonuclease V subunit gamma [Simkania negevensis]
MFYYQLSPCTTFWSDLSTSKERFFIDHRLEESKVSKQTREELQLYLKRGHPLLANFGKLEKENIKVFEEEGFPTEEHYLPPSPTTLLKKVQRDLFVDREEGEKEQLPKDPSLILSPASSKLREIEILYLTIRELLSDQSLLPSDIKIYAPDMEKYAPYIQLIFGAKHSPFAFHIRGTEILGKSPLLIAFFQLLSLREKRFSISAVFTLLFTPSFRKKFQLEEKDLFLFQKWMEKCGVKWGMDGKQKAHFLSAKEREELAQGSFEAAFERLLSSLGFLPEERGYFPSPILDISEGELLAKCIHLLRLLKEDSDFLENSFLSLEEWSLYLRSLVDRYFFPLEEERSFYLFLTEKIGNLPFLGSLTAGKKFPFSPIHQFLLSGMQEKGGSDFHHNLQSLSFSSLHLGGISEAKVICLIGMGEGEFPRSPFTSSLQELKKWKGADFSPSKIEEDRSLLLSTLLLAKERLIISYIHFDEKDGKETLPSLLVQELMSSLNRFYEIDGKKVSEAILRKHPPFSFHNSYFEKDSFLKNSSAEEYEKGAAFYLHPKPPYQPFIPEYTSIQSIEKEVQKEFLLNTKELFSFAKHPLRHYFNKELKIFYDFSQREEEEFLLSPLSRSLFKNGLLYDPFEKILAETIREGKLPFSPFKEVSIKELQKEAKELLSDLERHQIRREDLLTIELKAGCEKKEEIRKNYWILPPFFCPLSPKCHAVIEGKLPPITSKGLLIQGEKELSELVKIYPLYLVFSALKLDFCENALLFTKEKEGITLVKENKEEALQNYLLYYHASQSIPSPFLPSWAQVFLNKEASELQKKIDQALSLQQERIDPYLHAVFARKESFSAEAIHATWSPLLKKVFGALL